MPKTSNTGSKKLKHQVIHAFHYVPIRLNSNKQGNRHDAILNHLDHIKQHTRTKRKTLLRPWNKKLNIYIYIYIYICVWPDLKLFIKLNKEDEYKTGFNQIFLHTSLKSIRVR